jgi:gamma-glutamyl:cysteine ligase YbdK (ATP-grasp superfamily)
MGPWLAVLLALSANSPFWQGADSSYASFRYQAWGRWPSSGPTGLFGTARAWREGASVPETRTELLRLATWRASRSGLDDTLVNPRTGRPGQAESVVAMLLDHVSGALADAGETDTVREMLAEVLARGNGSTFQRDTYRRSGQLPEVVRSAVAVTAR